MANHMETYVQIQNGDMHIAEKLKEIFTPIEGEYQCDASDLLARLDNTPPTDYDRGWMIDEVGAKWMYSEFEYDDNPDFIQLHLTSAWSVPQGFLQQLAKALYTIKEDCYIVGTFEDESYDPIGAFVYAKGYDDIEDYDIDIDYDKIWEDDEYRDELYDKNAELRDELESLYKQQLEEEND